MATKAKEETAEAVGRGEEYVAFLIPSVSPKDRAVLIGVNGEFIRVRPGEQVRVRRKFAEVWANAQAQKREAWNTQTAAQAAAKKALAEL